ncbi:hypothetical protein Pan241w_10950 [Gimesia alba]|uniref:Uncharacterized protein n=1 Tax=Gimesia alba TaxID=2527973 RepID=A0A517RAX6_9PLAN|nr:hypothetical protein [Gimesia alba]QDT41036.1 hypothetical protein Pan241w_10950 [Gimesia alba]
MTIRVPEEIIVECDECDECPEECKVRELAPTSFQTGGACYPDERWLRNRGWAISKDGMEHVCPRCKKLCDS